MNEYLGSVGDSVSRLDYYGLSGCRITLNLPKTHIDVNEMGGNRFLQIMNLQYQNRRGNSMDSMRSSRASRVSNTPVILRVDQEKNQASNSIDMTSSPVIRMTRSIIT